MTNQNDFEAQPFVGFVMNEFMHKQSISLDLETLATKISSIARPYVTEALVMESRKVAAEAWNEEAVQALSILLPEISSEYSDSDVIEELQAALESPREPDDEEIREHCLEIANSLATAWLQFLSIVLESGKELNLNRQLIPKDTKEIEAELLLALYNSINSYVIDWEVAEAIFRQLGQDLFKPGKIFNLPLGIKIVSQKSIDNDNFGYTVRIDH